MTPVVLDASAYLALLRKETGWENVKTYLDRSLHISTVNLCEVATILYRNQEIPDPGAIRENIEAMRLNVQPYSMHHSFIAANISTFVPKDISLGDRSCLALAKELSAHVLTADRRWKEITIVGITIELIR